MRQVWVWALLGFAWIAVPAESVADTWYSAQVRWVYPTSNGDVIIRFAETTPLCTNTSNYFYIRVNEAGVTQHALNNMLSVSLTAASMGKALSVNFDETSQNCFVNRLYAVFN